MLGRAPDSPRGVWIAPFPGPHGETYLFPVASHGACVADPVPVPLGSDADVMAEGLWDLLDKMDPPAQEPSRRPPFFSRLRMPRSRAHNAAIRIVRDAS